MAASVLKLRCRLRARMKWRGRVQPGGVQQAHATPRMVALFERRHAAALRRAAAAPRRKWIDHAHRRRWCVLHWHRAAPADRATARRSVDRVSDGQHGRARLDAFSVQWRDPRGHMSRAEMQMHRGIRASARGSSASRWSRRPARGRRVHVGMQHPVAAGHRILRQPRADDVQRHTLAGGRLRRRAGSAHAARARETQCPGGDSISRSSTRMRPATSVPVRMRPAPGSVNARSTARRG